MKMAWPTLLVGTALGLSAAWLAVAPGEAQSIQRPTMPMRPTMPQAPRTSDNVPRVQQMPDAILDADRAATTRVQERGASSLPGVEGRPTTTRPADDNVPIAPRPDPLPEVQSPPPTSRAPNVMPPVQAPAPAAQQPPPAVATRPAAQPPAPVQRSMPPAAQTAPAPAQPQPQPNVAPPAPPRDVRTGPSSAPVIRMPVATPEVTASPPPPPSPKPVAPKPVVPAGPTEPDQRPFWAEVQKNNTPAARETLAKMRAAFPNWTPTADIVNALSRLEFDGRIKQLTAAREWPALLSLLSVAPDRIACGATGSLAPLGEALRDPSDIDRLEALYARLAQRCESPAERLAAMSRAAEDLPPERADKIFAANAPRIPALGANAAELARIETRIGARKLAAAKDPEDRVVLAEKLSPKVRETRDFGAALELGWAAYGRADDAAARDWFNSAYTWSKSADAAVGLASVAIRAGNFDEAERLIEGPAKKSSSYTGLRAQLVAARAGKALDAKEPETALNIVQEARDQGITSDALDEIEGYALLAMNQTDAAAQRFETQAAQRGTDGARLGLARVKLAQGDITGAENIARPLAPSNPDGRVVMRQVNLQKAQMAYEEGDFDTAITLSRTVLAEDPANIDARRIEAYALLDNGDAGEAYERFADLYRANPREDLAQGLAAAANKDGNVDGAMMIAAEAGGPLQEILTASVAQTVVGRKQFAYANDLMVDQRLEGAGDFEIAVGGAYRTKEGDKGRGLFDAISYGMKVGFDIGRARVEVMLRRVGIDAGKPVFGDPIGTPGVAWIRDPVSRLRDGLEPSISFKYEGQLEFTAELGLTPVGGQIDPTVTGRLGVKRYGGDGGDQSLEAFRQSRRDSLLSYTGIVDPATGLSYGQVLETGGALRLNQPLGEDLSVQAGVEYAAITGQNVKSNDRFSASLAAFYNLGLDDFDYVTIGPRVDYSQYKHNLSQYTYGQGGYFSPQSFWNFSLGAGFQTSEMDEWMLRGSVGVGWEMKREAATPILPLNPSAAGVTPGSKSAGLGASAALDGAYMIAPGWQLGGSVRYGTGETYKESLFGVFLRYNFGGKSSTISRDLDPIKIDTIR